MFVATLRLSLFVGLMTRTTMPLQWQELEATRPIDHSLSHQRPVIVRGGHLLTVCLLTRAMVLGTRLISSDMFLNRTLRMYSQLSAHRHPVGVPFVIGQVRSRILAPRM